MADFYPLLSRAVSKLRMHGPQARQKLYDHARRFLVTQLSGDEPRLSATEIICEQIALEDAIRRIEAQWQTNRSQPLNESKVSTASPVSSPTFGSVADHEWQDVYFDRAGNQSEISIGLWIDRTYELSVKDEALSPVALACANNPEVTDHLQIKGNGGIQPLDISNGTPIRIGASKRDQILRLGQPLIQGKRLKKLPAAEEGLEGRKFGLLDPTTIALVSIVAMLTFIVVVSIPAAAIYFPRLIWFAEHLIDHPMAIIASVVIVTLTLLLLFPLFGIRRRNSAFRSLRLLYPGRRVEH